jgi:plasmid stabilization system protein ParE
MTYKLIATSESESDIVKALEYYKAIDIRLAKRFLNDLKSTSHYIQNNPQKIQKRYTSIRVAFLTDFPFGIHFRLRGDTITIIGIFHTSIDAEKWYDR